MRNLIGKTLRLIARGWAMIEERDARIVHERFVEDVTRERSILDWRRALLVEELTAIAYRHAMGPAVCRNQLVWSLAPTRRKLQRVDERLGVLERQIGVHALLCDRNQRGQTQHATALH